MLIGKTIDEIELNMANCGLSLLITVSYGGWVLKKELCTWLLLQFLIAYGILLLKNQKPLWKFIVDSDPETIMKWLTFKYIEDVLTKDEAFNILQNSQIHKEKEYILF